MTDDATRDDAADERPAPIDALDYEQCRDELVEVVRRLEQGGLSLDDALALWERGEQLAARCEQHLAGARERIEAALTPETATGAD